MTQGIFVFGSNRAGRHGAGAARYALLKYKAVYGCGEGRQGESYAIPTKDEELKPLNLNEVEEGIVRFKRYALEHHFEAFLLTPIGCGLAGHAIEDIWHIFHKNGLPSNVLLLPSWLNDFKIKGGEQAIAEAERRGAERMRERVIKALTIKRKSNPQSDGQYSNAISSIRALPLTEGGE